ncbi:uncharacterized protein EV420DRAFT_1491533 [Desarmillaria tabescens]|uniref:Uncharacterized protein n=1 Tax=Armillaria tabescens TaxID=1929756 RepID=A0AA39ITY0_ARMTA|nr:uncharacterized protein EV420DRAFT_1491533 [Desarmillaria tabescens]KAK0430447.1 hypothetical protein EV420DRAFT_1491533 [Desarmillaria tabescens]
MEDGRGDLHEVEIPTIVTRKIKFLVLEQLERTTIVPISILLLHKLRGWKDNMESMEHHLWSKHDADVGDIGSLLRIVLEGMSMQERKKSMYWKRFALEWFNEEFWDGTKHRVWKHMRDQDTNTGLMQYMSSKYVVNRVKKRKA